MEPWDRDRLTDDVRGKHAQHDPAQALQEVYWRQQVQSVAAADRVATAWSRLPATAQCTAWQQRRGRSLADDLPPRERYAAAVEAHERATLLRSGGRRGAHLPSTYIDVETVPLAHQAAIGGRYQYRVWSDALVRDPQTYRGRALQPLPAAVARDLDAVLGAVRHAPLHPPDDRVVIFTEDHALRAALRDQGVILGPRYSAELAQERRQFYTLEAKQAVAVARDEVQTIETVWQTYSPAQQRRAYLDAGRGLEPTLWEQRLAAHTRLDRRQRMIPQASRDGALPAAFVEVEHGQPDAAPYAIHHWRWVWNTELGLTRYAHEETVSAWRVEQIVTVAQAQPATLYADDLRIRTQLQHHGLAVADTPHLAAQPPYRERAPEHEHERGRGVGK